MHMANSSSLKNIYTLLLSLLLHMDTLKKSAVSFAFGKYFFFPLRNYSCFSLCTFQYSWSLSWGPPFHSPESSLYNASAVTASPPPGSTGFLPEFLSFVLISGTSVAGRKSKYHSDLDKSFSPCGPRHRQWRGDLPASPDERGFCSFF